MRTSTLALTLLLLLCTHPALAQEQETSPTPNQAFVQLTLHAFVTAQEGVLELPAELIERVAEHEPLTKLDVRSAENSVHLQAEFSFSSIDAFNTWYASDAAGELVQLLNEESSGRVRLAFSMHRHLRP